MDVNISVILSDLIAQVGDPIFVKDEQHRWLYVNDACCAFWGCSREELIGKSDFDVFPEDEARVFWEKDDEVFRSGETVENQEQLTSSDGRTFWISTKKTVYIAPNGERYLVGIIRDLSDIKSAERKLKEALRFSEEAGLAKTHFLASVSHEFRTPLNGILGMADLLLDKIPDSEAREQLEILHECTRYLLTLVKDALDFSTIEHQGLSMQPTIFSIRKMIEVVKTIVGSSPQLGERQLEFVVEAGVPELVKTDPDRLRQLLLNLLENGLKFTPENGKIGLRLSRFTRHALDDCLCFEVTNDGEVIPERERERIFEPFVKLHPLKEGAGLGLAMARKLAELLGATVELDSGEQAGCRFRVLVPVQRDLRIQVPSKSGSDSFKFPGFRVLVVEDDPVSLKVATMMLRRFGCEIETAVHGKDAAEKLGSFTPDLILLDCQMPVMDGFEFSLWLRQREKERSLERVPVVALTAHALEAGRQRCLKSGMDEWLTKPLLKAPLAEVLGKYFPGSPSKSLA